MSRTNAPILTAVGLTGKGLFLGVSLCALQAAPAAAQDVPVAERSTQGVEEIVVTAQRREEELIDVPIAITAIGANEIQNITAGYMTDIGIKAPNVLMDQSSISPRISIRGITSQSNINAGFPPAIGVYVDEVYQGRDPTFNTILNDVERVELLRGPQGTLYGKNTIGGAINIITRDPTEEFTGQADVTLGSYDLFQARASVGGPVLGDAVLGRLSLVHRQRDGYLENTETGENLNDIEANGARVVLTSALTSNLSARFSADIFEETGTSALETGPAVLNGAVPALAAIPVQDPTDNVVQIDGDEFAERSLWGSSLRFDYDLSGLTLTSISAYRTYESDFGDDSDGLPVDAFTVGRAENGENFSQEIRLTSDDSGPFNWILGTYYYVENTENARRIRLGPDFPLLVAGLGAGIFYPTYDQETARTYSTIESSSWALFGSATIDLSENLHLGVGARYTDESKDFTYVQEYTDTYTDGPGPSIIAGFAVSIPQREESYDDGRLTGDVSLSYDISDDQMVFARYSRGFKAGGFQTDVISPPFDPSAQFGFDPETVDNYEVGYKSYWFDRRLELNLAAFQMDWQDKQEQVFTGLSFIIDNAASATTRGVELELAARPTPELTFDANFAYLDTEYEEFDGSPLAVGRPIPGQPETSGSVGVQYVTPIMANIELFTRADVIYRDDSFVNVTNNLMNEGLTTINARVGFQSADRRYGIYVWGRNITDEVTVRAGQNFPFPFANITTRDPGFGETYGLELRAEF